MAQLDDVVQRVLLQGDEEVIGKLVEIGEKGAEEFEKLADLSTKGLSGFEAFGDSIGLIGTALIGAGIATLNFVDAQDEAIQKTNFLAEAFGATTSEIVGLESAFAQAGVSTHTFERFAQRLTTTIAREWPQITEIVRTSADQQNSAHERIISSTVRVQDAQNSLGLVNEETSSKIANSNLRVEEAYTKLRFAAETALEAMRAGTNSVADADLALEAAQQRLAQTEGNGPSDADKKDLAHRQALQGVQDALARTETARTQQRQQQAEAAQKQQALEQAAADASLHHEAALNEASTARIKAENALKEAITARNEAQEHADQQALKDIPSIAKAFESITSGAKGATDAIDITQVSVQNLTKGIFLAASAGGVQPTGLQAMTKLSEVLSKDTDHLITSQQRLAIVQQLSQRVFGSTGAAAFQLLDALERGPDYFKKFEEASKNSQAVTKKSEEAIKHFRDSIALLENTIDLINRSIAAAATPAFTAAINAMNESLKNSDGVLHLFVEGVKAISGAIGTVVGIFRDLFVAIDKSFNLEKGRSFQIFLGLMVVLVGAFANAFLGIPAVIAVVVVSLGYIVDHLKDISKWVEDNRDKFIAVSAIVSGLIAFFAPIPVAIGLIVAASVLVYENWDKIKAKIGEVFEAIAKSPFGEFIGTLLSGLKSVLQVLLDIGKAVAKAFGFGGKSASAPGDTPSTTTGSEAPIQSHARGGLIHGPGTGTSDSILSWVSNGEFVAKTAAVQKYGADFFHSLNNMTFPGFASGGLVGAPTRLGGGGGPIQASRALNLTIDGKTFSGFRGPSNVVESLANYAVSRQTSSAGRQPSWVK
jgi:esterase/lipase